MKTIKILALAAASAMVLAAPAMAATITYTLTGNFQGTLNGQAFDTFATFTGVGDTNTFDGTTVQLSSLKAVAGGVTYTSLSQGYAFNNQGNGLSGFGTASGFDFLGFTGLSTAYDVNTAIGATPLTYAYGGQPFPTDNGTAAFSGASNVIFSASVAGAVPEPATWAMMICGVGMVGGAMRRRRVSTKVSFA
jgi:hypothetical protein